MTKAEVRTRLGHARTFLFVPGNQPERIEKALKFDTDAVIIDFEDAVRAEEKDHARGALSKALSARDQTNGPLVLVRTNSVNSPDFLLDLKAVFPTDVDAVMVPKFQVGQEVIKLNQILSDYEKENNIVNPIPVFGLIESAKGVLGLITTEELPDRIIRFAFGGADLHTDLGLNYSYQGANTIFTMAVIVMATANLGLYAPIDSPFFNLDDESGLRSSAEQALAAGFGGKLAIHPKQLPIIDATFQKSPSQIEWAEKVMAKWNLEGESRGALLVDGELIDEAMVKRAREILDLLN